MRVLEELSTNQRLMCHHRHFRACKTQAHNRESPGNHFSTSISTPHFTSTHTSTKETSPTQPTASSTTIFQIQNPPQPLRIVPIVPQVIRHRRRQRSPDQITRKPLLLAQETNRPHILNIDTPNNFQQPMASEEILGTYTPVGVGLAAVENIVLIVGHVGRVLKMIGEIVGLVCR